MKRWISREAEVILEIVKRTNCCICGSDSFKSALEIAKFPILMGTTLQEKSFDIFHDLRWATCSSCGCIQLLELIPLTVLYSQQHSAGAIGQIWQRHHEEFANFILKSNPESICEIGSAHGQLSQLILDAKPDIPYTIIEPAPLNVDSRVKMVVGIAEDHLDVVAQNKVVVHSHVIEHVYNAKEFLESLSEVMDIGTSMFISFPNIQELIDTGGSNSLNFEHTYFLDPVQLNSLLRTNGFTLNQQEMYLRHSYFLHVTKTSKQISIDLPLENIEAKSLTFVAMWKTLSEFVEHTNGILKLERMPTYIFGAHVFSQALFSLGLSEHDFDGVLDNSTGKIGERLYGTNLTVGHPGVIQGLDRVRVVLKASHYQEEVKKQLIDLNPNVEICE